MTLRITTAALAVGVLLSQGLAAEEPALKVEAEGRTTFDSLSGNYANWRSVALDVRARNASQQSYYGSLLETDRFALRDTALLLGTIQPLGSSWTVQLEAAISPTHHVLAKNSLLAQLERRFNEGWGVHVGYRRSHHTTTGSDLVIATVDRYFSNYRVAYSLYLGRPDGTDFAPSHRLQGSYYYGDRSSIGISAAIGKEVTNIPLNGVLTTQVRNITLAGQHELTHGWAATYEWRVQRQGDLYSQRGFGLGILRTF